jgi:hypothetical protein
MTHIQLAGNKRQGMDFCYSRKEKESSSKLMACSITLLQAERLNYMQPESALKPPFCSEHDIPMGWGETEFTFVEDGIEVIVRHIPAWVCPHHDDAVRRE